ncbi:mitogen-activated protein kinase kinase kinase 7-like [Penaeus vannamei]|uniref:mitogen-activated protein kinase kinase kinase 7-like n=1 Tax=Penaeus vannamei TaxID=6689 RepID=UPI00387F39DA
MEILRRLQGAGGAPVPLAYSEEPAGIVHCDLKPTNVMVQLRGAAGAPSVHVIDFGLALPAGQSHPASSKGRHSWYFACVHQGTPLTEKCDVVGVGVMLQFVAESMKAPPAALQALAERAQRPEHEQRPSVQEIARRCRRCCAAASERPWAPSGSRKERVSAPPSRKRVKTEKK